MKVRELVEKCRCDPGKNWHVELVDGQPWIFFHASWTRQDWVRCFETWTVPFCGGRAHAGFVKEFRDDLQVGQGQLYKDILIYSLNAETLTFAGYSRGAALALLAYTYMQGLTPSRLRCVLVGSPNVFTKIPPTLVHSWGSVEVIYGRDVVTALPPWFKGNPVNDIQLVRSSNRGLLAPIHDHAGYATAEQEIDLRLVDMTAESAADLVDNW